ncbi:hypothetical protein CQW23_14467 [Capsicum baccatum]|uniref:Uncharacterized protein n=1 Tax=Capsicum baccatum TaxID=33114 RepID=A0A2G2WJG5_CAPBA|nr:hypothetical protein CQW23_14467 [Capsicum baccatum]
MPETFCLNTEQRGKRPFVSDARQVEDLSEESSKQAINSSYRSGQVNVYDYIIGNTKNVVGFSNTMRVTDEGMNLSKGTALDAL